MLEIRILLDERLKEKGMSQKRLAELTGITERTISELANNKTIRIPKNAIERIANALEITDIREILTLE